MSRIVADDLKNISIYKLKKWGLLVSKNNSKVGRVEWSRDGEITSKVGYEFKYEHTEPVVFRVYFSAVDTDKEYDYRIRIDRTECNYGGGRYWFSCPGCFKRTAILYIYDYVLRCRKCLNLTYWINNRSPGYRRLDALLGSRKNDEYVERLERTGRYFYAGKPTKTYQKHLKARQRIVSPAAFDKWFSY